MYIHKKFAFIFIVSSIFSTLGFAANVERKITKMYLDASIVMKGRVVSIEGGCTAIDCGYVNYAIETYKLFVNRDNPDIRYSDFSRINICANSGLELGKKYVFMMKTDQQKKYFGINKIDLPCQFYSDKTSIFMEIDSGHHYKIQNQTDTRVDVETNSQGPIYWKRDLDFEKEFQQAVDSDTDAKEQAIRRNNPPKQ